MTLKIMPGATPFFFAGDRTQAGARIGCLCLHGLNASPQEVYWLGKFLSQQGAMVYGPRLFGHGINVEELNRSRWQDWYASALDGYYLLRQNCDAVFALGLSMGGLCSLYLAANEELAGVVPMAAALRLRSDARASHILRYTGMTVLRYDRSKDVIDQRVKALQAERGEPITGRVSYYAHKATGISELLRFQAEVDSVLARVSCPALLIFSEGDTVIPFEVMAELRTKMTAARTIETLPLTQSDHILTNDSDMERVFETSWAFIQSSLRQAAGG